VSPSPSETETSRPCRPRSLGLRPRCLCVNATDAFTFIYLFVSHAQRMETDSVYKETDKQKTYRPYHQCNWWNFDLMRTLHWPKAGQHVKERRTVAKLINDREHASLPVWFKCQKWRAKMALSIARSCKQIIYLHKKLKAQAKFLDNNMQMKQLPCSLNLSSPVQFVLYLLTLRL